MSFGPPDVGVEKSISFGPPHDEDDEDKSVVTPPSITPRGTPKRHDEDKSVEISNAPPSVTPRGTPKRHDEDKAPPIKAPPITPRGTPKRHDEDGDKKNTVEATADTGDDSSKQDEKQEDIPPPPISTARFKIKRSDTEVENDYEALPVGPPPRITSNAVLQSFDYGIPPKDRKPSLWYSLDKIVESNEHDSTTTDEEEEEEEEKVGSLSRRPSSKLKSSKIFR